MSSYLELISAADNFPYQATSGADGELYVPFHLTLQDYEAQLPPLGLLRPAVLIQLRGYCNKRETTLAHCPSTSTENPLDLVVATGDDGNETVLGVCFASIVKHDDLGLMLTGIIVDWKTQGLFSRQLDDPKNEECDIHVDHRSSYTPSWRLERGSGLGFAFSRDAASLFGFKAFAVHMTAYEGDGKDMKIWVPKRSAMKLTYAGSLDNTVGGGITAGSTPLQAITQECEEEANLSGDFVRKYIQSTGLVSFMMRTDDGGLCPQTIYTYDMELPNQTDGSYQQPKPNDGEVEWFKLLPLSAVVDGLLEGQFRPSAAVVLIDFMVRHGLISPEDEGAYQHLGWRVKRNLDLSMLHAAGKVM